jgi:hypothetical protein
MAYPAPPRLPWQKMIAAPLYSSAPRPPLANPKITLAFFLPSAFKDPLIKFEIRNSKYLAHGTCAFSLQHARA